MRDRRALLPLFLVLALVAFSGACKKKQPQTEPTPPPAEEPERTPPPPPPPPKKEVKETFEPPKEERLTAIDINNRRILQTVYFAFDSAELTPTAQQTLRSNAQWLKSNPGYKIVIQGHCDERGTIEYNLALGERRANAVRDYMTSLGTSRNSMRVVSYGEERPAAPGHDESAWSQNRRAEFLAED